MQIHRELEPICHFIFAVVALLPRRLLPLVALTWLVREAVELGLKCRQTLIFLLEMLFFLFERGAESLDLILSVILFKGAGESRTLVPLDVLALQVVLRTLDGIVGVSFGNSSCTDLGQKNSQVRGYDRYAVRQDDGGVNQRHELRYRRRAPTPYHLRSGSRLLNVLARP